jgi:hypothetical protein
MEFLNKVQQIRAHAGSHKGAAILAGRFCQSGVLAIEAPSKYPIIARSFGSTGSVHGIPPNLRAIMTEKNTEGQDLNHSLVTSGRTCGSRWANSRQEIVKQKAGKSPIGKRWAEEAGEAFATLETG